MNLSAEEAISRVNESVTVEMVVQKTKSCTGSCQVFLDSEQNHRDPKNLGLHHSGWTTEIHRSGN